ncbi:MAG: RluA family pseudouridine synthase [Candidatus Lernaella stagnicola]|nr:RluA family pseudouridine synthase [Candidatus Lernaella stagnicola]
MQKYETIIPTDMAGVRLDQAAASLVQDLTRSRAGQLIKEGHITLDGHPAKPATTVRPGQRLVADIPPPPASGLRPQALDLDIVFEDEHLLVVNKAPGMVVHPAAGNPDGTLVNALLHHVPALADAAGEDRPGIVHRLDKGTSGLLVVAKTGPAMQDLQRQFAQRTVTKKYLALVTGRPRDIEGRMENAIGRHVTNRKKMSSVTVKGKSATTLYRVESSTGEVSALTCTLLTGRTHQIRVHCAESGWPLVGDDLYGGVRPLHRLTDPELRAACQALRRPALHARELGFEHPARRAYVEFTAPIPGDLAAILEIVEKSNA